MYPNDRWLRLALRANAVFSLSSSALMIALPSLVASVLGTVSPTLIRVVGVLVGLGGLDMLLQASKSRMHAGKAVGTVVGDGLWVLATLFILLSRPASLTGQGLVILAAVGSVVLVFGLAQTMGLRRYAMNLRRTTSCASMYEFKTIVSASPTCLWSALKDLGRMGEFHPALTQVRIDDVGDRVVRTCVDNRGKQWSEELMSVSDTTRSLTLRFATEAKGFPFPMKSMVGGWEVSPSGTGSEVTVWYECTLKGGLLGEIAAPLMAPSLDRLMGTVVERMAAACHEVEGAPTA